MDNHYYFIVRTRRANLEKAMQWFGTTYTQRFNQRHFRSGHLFQGRYKSIIIQYHAYLLLLSYYIHRNPLRAGIAKRLTIYRWSSYNFYAYGRNGPKWLLTVRYYLNLPALKITIGLIVKKFRNMRLKQKTFFGDLRHGFILGPKQFAEKIRKRYPLVALWQTFAG